MVCKETGVLQILRAPKSDKSVYYVCVFIGKYLGLMHQVRKVGGVMFILWPEASLITLSAEL